MPVGVPQALVSACHTPSWHTCSNNLCVDHTWSLATLCIHEGQMMCRTYRQFLSRVAAGRNMSMQEARKVARGRIWTGQDALQHGLVDSLGGLTDAVHIAKQEADLSLVSSIFWPLVCMLPTLALPCSCSHLLVRQVFRLCLHMHLMQMLLSTCCLWPSTHLPYQLDMTSNNCLSQVR